MLNTPGDALRTIVGSVLLILVPVWSYEYGPQPKSDGVAAESVEPGAQAPRLSGPHVRKLKEHAGGNVGWSLYCIRGQAVLWTNTGVYPLTEAEPCSYR